MQALSKAELRLCKGLITQSWRKLLHNVFLQTECSLKHSLTLSLPPNLQK
jgi:hypothetical protein